ncbi:MAG: TetR/AcrR family transcriptional regulator [Pseudomonadales bacterium]|nr:TetR/AcrR family transcriptional regulator [Pseudomonadales bacterium]
MKKSPKAEKSFSDQYRKPTQNRSKFTVSSILEAATYVFIEKGLADTTTNDVAERAGVSISSLYQYFPNKHALVAALTEEHLNQMITVISEGLSQYLQSSISELLHELVTLVINAHSIHPELHRVLIEESGVDRATKEIVEFENRLNAMTVAYLESQKEELVVNDIKMAGFIVFNTIETLTHRAILNRSHSENEGVIWPISNKEVLIAEITRLLVNYLCKE